MRSDLCLGCGVYRASGQMLSAGELASGRRFTLIAKPPSACFPALCNGSRYLWHRIGTLIILTCHY